MIPIDARVREILDESSSSRLTRSDIRAAAETMLVRNLGDAIGYGRVMQLSEHLWSERAPDAALSVGPCAGLLVTCPCPRRGLDRSGHCLWCCGSRRVTGKVAAAMRRL